MIKFLSLSSGSCGNCYFLGIFPEDAPACTLSSPCTGLIVDAGISLRALKAGLSQYGLSTDCFSSILVTHDHLDHIRGLGSFCKKLSPTVFSSEVIINAISRHTYRLDSINALRRSLKPDEWNVITDGISARFFVVPHDATQTVGYALRLTDGDTEHKLVIMTDLGRMTAEALQWAQWADTVIVESNYDAEMLRNGSYPEELKERIHNGYGHLSNDECAEAIRTFAHEGLRNLFLCHLSENNNTPRLAYDSARAALEAVSAAMGPSSGRPVNLRALPRRTPSGLIIL